MQLDQNPSAAPKSNAEQTPTAPAASPLTTPELPKAPEKLLTTPNGNSVGAIVGIIIILIVLIVGALYFWGAKLAEEEQGGFIPEEETAANEVAQ